MKHFTITIPDNKVRLFIEMMKSLSFVEDIVENDEIVIPEEHKAIVNERIEKYKNKPENYSDWEDIDQKIKQDNTNRDYEIRKEEIIIS